MLDEVDKITHLSLLSLQGWPFPLVLLLKKLSDFGVKNI